MGAKSSNPTPPSNHCRFFLKLLLKFLLDRPHKTAQFWIFEILDFLEILVLDFWPFEILNSPLYPIGKRKTSIIWKKNHHRAKRSEIWALG